MNIDNSIFPSLKKRITKSDEQPKPIEINPKDSNMFQHFIEANNLINCSFYEVKVDVDYLELRNKQNIKYAYKLTVDGINYAKKNEFGAAMKKYDSALQMDPNCTEALVARGAWYFCFKKVLRIRIKLIWLLMT